MMKIDNLVYKILAVDPVSYSIDIPQDFIFNKEIHKMNGESSANIEVDTEKEVIKCSIDFKLRCRSVIDNDTPLDFFKITSVSTFKLENIKSYFINENQEDINEEVINFFFKMSMTHTRGMQSVILKGTPFTKYLVPDIDFNLPTARKSKSL